jgi:sugar phosphate isomerase/epimerase
MVQEVDSPNLRICLDAPLVPDKNPAVIDQAAQAVGASQVLSHFGGEFERRPDGSIRGFDRHDGIVQPGDTNQYYADLVRAVKRIGYTGYLSYELCHQLPLVNGQTVDIEYAHHNAKLAAEFVRQLIDS